MCLVYVSVLSLSKNNILFKSYICNVDVHAADHKATPYLIIIKKKQVYWFLFSSLPGVHVALRQIFDSEFLFDFNLIFGIWVPGAHISSPKRTHHQACLIPLSYISFRASEVFHNASRRKHASPRKVLNILLDHQPSAADTQLWAHAAGRQRRQAARGHREGQPVAPRAASGRIY